VKISIHGRVTESDLRVKRGLPNELLNRRDSPFDTDAILYGVSTPCIVPHAKIQTELLTKNGLDPKGEGAAKTKQALLYIQSVNLNAMIK